MFTSRLVEMCIGVLVVRLILFGLNNITNHKRNPHETVPNEEFIEITDKCWA